MGLKMNTKEIAERTEFYISQDTLELDRLKGIQSKYSYLHDWMASHIETVTQLETNLQFYSRFYGVISQNLSEEQTLLALKNSFHNFVIQDLMYSPWNHGSSRHSDHVVKCARATALMELYKTWKDTFGF
jgi:hypothetical protein